MTESGLVIESEIGLELDYEWALGLGLGHKEGPGEG